MGLPVGYRNKDSRRELASRRGFGREHLHVFHDDARGAAGDVEYRRRVGRRRPDSSPLLEDDAAIGGKPSCYRYVIGYAGRRDAWMANKDAVLIKAADMHVDGGAADISDSPAEQIDVGAVRDDEGRNQNIIGDEEAARPESHGCP